MSTLYFKVEAEYDKVIKLRQEIENLKSTMKTVNPKSDEFSKLNERLSQSTREFQDLTRNAAQACATMQGDLKRKVYEASQSVNDLTQKIIAQKTVIKDVQFDVKRLGEAYRDAKKNKGEFAASGALNEYKAAQKALDNERAALFALTQQQAEARLSVKRLRDDYALYKQDASNAVDATVSIKDQLTKAFAAIGGAAALKKLVTDIINVRGQFEQADTAIQTMLGSKEKADALMKEVRQYATISPLTFGDITSATQMMIGFNIEAEKVPQYIKAIGDVSMGNSQQFNSLTLAFSQMSAAGKLMGQDLNQMINAGFNPLSIMAEKSGKSIAQLKEEMSKGQITAKMVQDAFIAATSAGGKFYNMSENAAKTIPGQISMLEDSLDKMFNDIGTASEGLIVNSIKGVTSLIENYQRVGQVLVGLATAYGIYKTAVILATAAEEGHTIKMVLLRGVVIATEKAQALLNATMLSNPYVAVAAVLAALVGTLVATSSTISDVDAVQNTLNDTLKDAEEKQQKYNEETKNAIDIARNDASATDDRRKAMKLLIQRYPSIIKKYIDEEGHLKNILQLKREIAAIDGNGQVQAHQRKADQYTQTSQALHRIGQAQLSGGKISKADKALEQQAIKQYAQAKGIPEWRVKMFTSTKEIIKFYDDLAAGERKIASRTQNTNRANTWGDTFSQLTNGRLQGVINSLKKAKETKKNVTLAFNAVKGVVLTQQDIDVLLTKAEGIQTARKGKKEDKKNLDDRKKKLQAQLDALTYEEAAGKKGKELLKKINAINEKEKVYSATNDTKEEKKKAQEAKKAATKAKKEQREEEQATKAEVRLTAEQLEQRKKQKRNAEDVEFDTREAIIKAKEDSREKTLAQYKLDYDKEKNQIERNYEDLKDAKIKAAKALFEANPDNKGKNFYESDEYMNAGEYTDDEKKRFAAQNLSNEAQYARHLQSLAEQDRAAMNSYLEKYGTFQQQKLAIAEEYDEKIRKAQTTGEKMMLERQKKDAIAAVDARSLSMNIDWSKAFSGIGNVLQSVAKETLQKVTEYMKTDEFRSLSAESKKAYSDLAGKLRQEGGGTSTSPFNFKIWGQIADQVKAYQESVRVLDAKTQAHTKAVDAYAKAQKKVKEAQDALAKATNDNAKQQATAALAVAQFNAGLLGKKVKSTGAEQTSAQNDKDQAEQNLTNSTEAATNGLQNFASYLQEMNNGSLYGFANGITKLITSLSKGSEGVGKSLGELGGKIGGIIGAILQILDALGDNPAGFIHDLLDRVDKAISGIIRDLPSIVVDIVKGVVNIIGGIIEGIGSWFGSDDWMFGSNAKEVKELTDKLTKSNDALNKSINNLKESIDNSAGSKAVSDYQKAYDEQEQVIKQTMEILQAQMGYHDKHHSNAYNWNLNRSDYSSINKILSDYAQRHPNEKFTTTKVSSLGDIYKLTPEQMNAIATQNVKLWQKMLDAGKYDKSEYWENYIELAGTLEELTEKINENLTQVSFSSMHDSFVSEIMNMDQDWTDFTEDFTEKMAKAYTNAAVGDLMDEDLKKFQQEWAEAMKSGNLDKNEIDKLKEQWDALVQQGLDIRANMQAVTGYTGDTTQSATAKGLSSISYDQASNIEGIVRAIQIGVDQGNAKKDQQSVNVSIVTATLSQMKALSVDGNTLVDEIRTIQVNAYMELQGIHDDTTGMKRTLSEMGENVTEIRKRIENI